MVQAALISRATSYHVPQELVCNGFVNLLEQSGSDQLVQEKLLAHYCSFVCWIKMSKTEVPSAKVYSLHFTLNPAVRSLYQIEPIRRSLERGFFCYPSWLTIDYLYRVIKKS
jgi:hypothetical protein